MRTQTIIVAALLCVASTSVPASGQVRAKIVDLAGLQKVIQASGSEVRVISFWATWCAPCIKELPLLEKLGREHQDVKVTLVSLDLDMDPNPEKVHKFVERKKLESSVLILDAGNPNDWIDKVESRWSGALPATLIVNSKTGKRAFVERELHEGDLEKLIAEVQ